VAAGLGGGQTWDPELYAREAAFVPALGLPVVELLAPRQGERILDLGCGDGQLTKALADAGASVVGVDASPEMVVAARRRGLDAETMDGRDLPFVSRFDAVFSNAAIHWMADLQAVLAGVFRALKPGGRFVGEFGAEGNVASVRAALGAALSRRGIDPAPFDPWTFPSAPRFRSLLEATGFRVVHLETLPRETPVEGDLAGWLETFGRSFLDALPPGDRAPAIEEIAAQLAPERRDPWERWVIDYVRLRFAAVRPDGTG
jgi:SAM-dependent methyltransferase